MSAYLAQVEDVIDLFEWHPAYAGCQLIFQIDWSSGHSKRADGGLGATELNWRWGGKQPLMRPSKLEEGDIGVEPTRIRTADGGERDIGVKLG